MTETRPAPAARAARASSAPAGPPTPAPSSHFRGKSTAHRHSHTQGELPQLPPEVWSRVAFFVHVVYARGQSWVMECPTTENHQDSNDVVGEGSRDSSSVSAPTERPTGRPGRRHQHGLTAMMRVNSILNQAAAPHLYSNPIVYELDAFLCAAPTPAEPLPRPFGMHEVFRPRTPVALPPTSTAKQANLARVQRLYLEPQPISTELEAKCAADQRLRLAGVHVQRSFACLFGAHEQDQPAPDYPLASYAAIIAGITAQQRSFCRTLDGAQAAWKESPPRRLLPSLKSISLGLYQHGGAENFEKMFFLASYEAQDYIVFDVLVGRVLLALQPAHICLRAVGGPIPWPRDCDVVHSLALGLGISKADAAALTPTHFDYHFGASTCDAMTVPLVTGAKSTLRFALAEPGAMGIMQHEYSAAWAMRETQSGPQSWERPLGRRPNWVGTAEEEGYAVADKHAIDLEIVLPVLPLSHAKLLAALRDMGLESEAQRLDSFMPVLRDKMPAGAGASDNGDGNGTCYDTRARATMRSAAYVQYKRWALRLVHANMVSRVPEHRWETDGLTTLSVPELGGFHDRIKAVSALDMAYCTACEGVPDVLTTTVMRGCLSASASGHGYEREHEHKTEAAEPGQERSQESGAMVELVPEGNAKTRARARFRAKAKARKTATAGAPGGGGADEDEQGLPRGWDTMVMEWPEGNETWDEVFMSLRQ